MIVGKLKKIIESVNWGQSDIYDYIPNFYYFAKDTNGYFIRANKAFVKLMHLKSHDNFLGFTDEHFFPKFLCSKYRKDDKQVMATGNMIKNQMELIVNDSGQMDWFFTTKVPLFTHKGEIIGVECISRYIKSANLYVKSDFECKKSIQFIIENFNKKIAINDLAEIEGISMRQFERNFKFHYGISPKRYIEKTRLDAACQQLVNSSLTACQISNKTGFFDSSHFTHTFKRRFQMSPTEFRRTYSD